VAPRASAPQIAAKCEISSIALGADVRAFRLMRVARHTGRQLRIVAVDRHLRASRVPRLQHEVFRHEFKRWLAVGVVFAAQLTQISSIVG
jgi:hypothetical protein